MTDLIIRPAEPGDCATIVEFNAALARETEGKDLDRARLTAGVTAALADPGKAFYRLAQRDGRAVGQLMITREWSDWRNGDFWWIQSVYVVPVARRQGVFRALYADILAEAKRRPGVCGLRLYAERQNRRAHATYATLGMHDAGYRMFEVDFVIGHAASEKRKRR